MRVPSTGPKTSERRRKIARLKRRLAEMDKVPEHRREDECADEIARACRIAIDELEQRHG
jgi:hypothetical protein